MWGGCRFPVMTTVTKLRPSAPRSTRSQRSHMYSREEAPIQLLQLAGASGDTGLRTRPPVSGLCLLSNSATPNECSHAPPVSGSHAWPLYQPPGRRLRTRPVRAACALALPPPLWPPPELRSLALSFSSRMYSKTGYLLGRPLAVRLAGRQGYDRAGRNAPRHGQASTDHRYTIHAHSAFHDFRECAWLHSCDARSRQLTGRRTRSRRVRLRGRGGARLPRPTVQPHRELVFHGVC